MIKENIKVRFNENIKVTRICDVCKREDIVKLSSICYSRRVRHRKLDLCKSCACKDEFLDKPRKKCCIGHHKHLRNENSPLWKGGIDKLTGYKKISDANGKNMREHRLVMQEYLSRNLEKNEIVHHIDTNKLNNSIDNLYLFSSYRDHFKSHDSLEKCGLYFLGSRIWFNYNEKKYVMEPFTQNRVNVDISDLLKEKIYYKTDHRSLLKYAFLYIRIGTNVWEWKRLHVAIAERLLGRDIGRSECVHHIDCDTLNNDIMNLIVLRIKEHNLCHSSLEECSSKLFNEGLISFNRDSGTYFCSLKVKNKIVD